MNCTGNTLALAGLLFLLAGMDDMTPSKGLVIGIYIGFWILLSGGNTDG